MIVSAKAPYKAALPYASISLKTTACLSGQTAHYTATTKIATVLTSFQLPHGYKAFMKMNMVYFGSTPTVVGSTNITAVREKFSICYPNKVNKIHSSIITSTVYLKTAKITCGFAPKAASQNTVVMGASPII
ncbi:hypothetical protein D3C73_751560 [compost metagenome]